MNSKIPHTTTTVECPNSKRNCQVNLEINVFRGATHGGVEVITCSEFLHTKGIPSCGQDCVHLPQTKAIHDQEVRKHQEELRKIGSNVIG